MALSVGFGDNIRVVKWIFDRCDTPIDAKNAYASN